jgi:hypothetical protein
MYFEEEAKCFIIKRMKSMKKAKRKYSKTLIRAVLRHCGRKSTGLLSFAEAILALEKCEIILDTNLRREKSGYGGKPAKVGFK